MGAGAVASITVVASFSTGAVDTITLPRTAVLSGVFRCGVPGNW